MLVEDADAPGGPREVPARNRGQVDGAAKLSAGAAVKAHGKPRDREQRGLRQRVARGEGPGRSGEVGYEVALGSAGRGHGDAAAGALAARGHKRVRVDVEYLEHVAGALIGDARAGRERDGLARTDRDGTSVQGDCHPAGA